MSQGASRARSRRIGATVVIIGAVALIAIVAVVVSLVVTAGSPAADPSPAPPGDRGSAQIGTDGFRLQLADGVAVSGGPGVAASGTEVHAELSTRTIPGEFGTFATAVAPVVAVTLGEGIQPAEPI